MIDLISSQFKLINSMLNLFNDPLNLLGMLWKELVGHQIKDTPALHNILSHDPN